MFSMEENKPLQLLPVSPTCQAQCAALALLAMTVKLHSTQRLTISNLLNYILKHTHAYHVTCVAEVLQTSRDIELLEVVRRR